MHGKSIFNSLLSKLIIITSAFLIGACNCGNGSVTTTPSATPIQLGGAIQGGALTLSANVSTFAGAPGTPATTGSTDATGTSARFNQPFGVTTDGTSLYVADTYNHTVRKIVISSGIVTTLAGTALSPGSSDGTGAAARFNYPIGITTDGINLYVADYANHTIRKIVISSGAVSTLAGTATLSGSVDGTGALARFSSPSGITTDGSSVYVSDTANHTLRKIVISSGVVSTLAGTATVAGSTDGIAAMAKFNFPEGLTVQNGNLYMTDSANHTVRKIVISSGDVKTIAGTALVSGANDGIGMAAQFQLPASITTDGTNLYVTDTSNHTVRKIVIASGDVTTVAGTAGTIGAADNTGTAASFNTPRGITSDGHSLFVADRNNSTIRKIQ